MSQYFVKAVAIIFLCGLIGTSLPVYGRLQITITAIMLQQDKDALLKYIMESVANDVKQAKKAGKMLAHAMGGVSFYAYDSIPWLFFEDPQGIQKAFERLCDEVCVQYVQSGKEEYKTNIQRKRPRINRSQLGEFMHRRMTDVLNISDEYKKILRVEPAKMDEFMQQGIISKDDYMFYNLLGLIMKYYLEKEYGKHR